MRPKNIAFPHQIFLKLTGTIGQMKESKRTSYSAHKLTDSISLGADLVENINYIGFLKADNLFSSNFDTLSIFYFLIFFIYLFIFFIHL